MQRSSAIDRRRLDRRLLCSATEALSAGCTTQGGARISSRVEQPPSGCRLARADQFGRDTWRRIASSATARRPGRCARAADGDGNRDRSASAAITRPKTAKPPLFTVWCTGPASAFTDAVYGYRTHSAAASEAPGGAEDWRNTTG